jgi:hypothetical protein
MLLLFFLSKTDLVKSGSYLTDLSVEVLGTTNGLAGGSFLAPGFDKGFIAWLYINLRGR